tara:strand:- start:178 stop:1038 length:861 start_codon:yes stop_codon:yes gene_type:complete
MYKILSLLILISTAFQAQGIERKTKPDLDNLAVVVPSCDKYAEAWIGFFQLLEKYWPELNNEIYLIGGNKTYEKENLINVSIPNEKSWSDNMLQVLDMTQADYILILLEDYYITEPVNHKKFVSYYNIMRQEGSASLVLAPRDEYEKIHPFEKGLAYLNRDQPYRASLQAVIWKKDILKKILKSGESPWQFELKGTFRTRDLKEPFMIVTGKGPLNYLGAISRGQWSRKAMKLIKKEKLKFNRNMPSESLPIEIYNAIKGWISLNINQPIKKFFGVEEKTLMPGWF